MKTLLAEAQAKTEREKPVDIEPVDVKPVEVVRKLARAKKK